MTRFERLQQYIQESPNDPFLLFAMAKEYEGQEQEDQALAYYQKVVEVDPHYVGVYYHLGKWHERARNPEKAAEIYQMGMEVAKRQGDRHAAGELATALELLD